MERDRRILRTFGLVLAVFLGGIFGGVLPALGLIGFQTWIWLLSMALVVVALAVPALLAPVHWAWMKLGGVLGWVNTRLLLGAVFFAVIWPMGVVRKLSGSKAITKDWDPNASSYRVASISKRNSSYFERPY